MIKKQDKVFFCSACLLFQITSTVLKMACENFKDSLKIAIFLEHQKSWGQRVQIYSTDYQEMTWNFSS